MKISRFIQAGLMMAAMAFSFSCKDPVEEDPAEKVEIAGIEESVNFNAQNPETVSFTIQSNYDWVISKKDADWLTVSVTEGVADKLVSVNLTAENNESAAAREGKLTVTSGKYTQDITVCQFGSDPVITVSGIENKSLEFESVGGTATFTVSGNVNWIIVQDNLGWCEITPAQGDGGETVTVTLTAAINNGDAREGSFTVKSDAEDYVVTVKEAKVIPYFKAEQDSVAIPMIGGKVALKVNSNKIWTVTSSESWLTVTPSTGTGENFEVSLSAEKNVDMSRTAELLFKADDLEDVVVKVSQEAIVMNVSKEKFSLSSEAATVGLVINSNLDWKATSSASWLTVTPAAGIGEDIAVQISAQKNTGDLRTATVTVTTDVVDPITITVVQSKEIAPDPSLPKTLVEWNLPKSKKEQTAFVAHNPGWVVNGTAGTYNDSGVIIAEDNVNTGTWYAAHKAPFTGPESYFRTNYSSGLALNGVWMGDGFKFTCKNTTAPAGRQIAFYCGMRTGNAQVLGYWGVRYSFDGGKTWNEADEVRWVNTNGVELTHLVAGTADVIAHYRLTEDLNGADVVIFVYTKDIAIGADEVTEIDPTAEYNATNSVNKTIRFELPNTQYNGQSYIGPTIVLEN